MVDQPAPPLPDWLARLFPLTRCVHVIDDGADAGRRIHYVDHGPRDAPAVVMCHGNPTWSFLWRKVIAELPDMRCLAPDMLGLGLSDKLPREDDHTYVRHLDALTDWLRALDLPRVILVGQDWGGPIAMGLGQRLPDRVSGIVLANTSVLVPRRPRGTWFHRFARLPVVSRPVFRWLGAPQKLLWVAQGDRRSIRGDVARAYRWPLRHLRDRAAPQGLARMVGDRPDHPSVAPMRETEAWVRGFEGPIALVWGTRDPILGRALRRHREAFPDAPVTETDAGHFLQEEVPAAIAAAIADVAARAGVASARPLSTD